MTQRCHARQPVEPTHQRPRSILCVIVFLAFCPSIARADPVVLFNNFGPGGVFDIGTLDGVFVPIVPAPFFVGFSFTPQRDSVLHDVTAAISSRAIFGFESATAVNLTIRQRGVEGVPEAILGTLRLQGLGRFGQPYSPPTVTSDEHLLLHGGVPYWLTATAESGLAVWNFNSIGHQGDVIVTDDNDECCFFEFGSTGAFRITATAAVSPTPEPTTLLSVVFGFGVTLWARRKIADTIVVS